MLVPALVLIAIVLGGLGPVLLAFGADAEITRSRLDPDEASMRPSGRPRLVWGAILTVVVWGTYAWLWYELEHTSWMM